MLGSTIPLQYLVGVSGQGAAQAQLSGLTTTMERSRGAFGAPLNVGGWLRPLAGVRSALSGIGKMALGVLGGMGLGAGIGGFTRLIKESSTFHQDLISLKATLNLTDQETADLSKRMEDLAVATGRSRVELLAAARAGTDYGLSLQETTDNMADLDAMARVMKVSPETLMGGVGGLHKLAGEGVDQGTLRTMLFEGQQASGMREEPFLELVRRMAPQFSGDKRFEGQGGTALFLANISALGDTMGEDGKKLKSGLKGFLDGLNDTTPKTVKAFKDLGINTGDARVAQTQLIAAILGGKQGIEDLPAPLRDFLDQIIATDGAVGRLEASQDTLSGDLTGMGKELQSSLDAIKNEPTWDKLMERFKGPLIKAADHVFGVLMEWGPKVLDALSSFAAGLTTAGERAGQWLAEILGIDTAGQVAEAEAAGVTDADRLEAAGFYSARTPEERAAALKRAGGAAQGYGSETWQDRAAAIQHNEEGDWFDRWATPEPEGTPGTEGTVLSRRAAVLFGRGLEGSNPAPVVNVFIDPRVDADATHRTEGAASPTMPSPAGVAP